MRNEKKTLQIIAITICLLMSVLLLACCGGEVHTADVLPTPTITPQPSPESVKISFETATESVTRPNATDVTVHESIDLGLLKADYFAMPPYREMDDYYHGIQSMNLRPAKVEGNAMFSGLYVLTDEGMVWKEPSYYYGEFTMYGFDCRYLEGFVEADGQFYDVFRAERAEIYPSAMSWKHTEDGSGIEGLIKAKYYPVILNVETGVIRDFLREINPELADLGVANGGAKIITNFGDQILFYLNVGNEVRFFYVDVSSNKAIEFTEVPSKARIGLKHRFSTYVVGVCDGAMLVSFDKKYSEPEDDKRYYLCDTNSGRITVLEDLVGEELNGCAIFDGQVVCAGEKYYWKVDIDSLEKEVLLETKDVAIGYIEARKTDYNLHELFNNASFVIAGEQGNYKLYDFAKGTISDLDQLGRWAELEAANYVVSPDGRKLVVYGGTQNGCIQFGVLNCDTNTFVDVVREAPSDMTDETRIWWYKDSAVAVAQEDRQIISVYTIE